jgi:hypothetical protein
MQLPNLNNSYKTMLAPSYQTVWWHSENRDIAISSHKINKNTIQYYDKDNNMIAEYDGDDLSYYVNNEFKFKIYYDITYKDDGKIDFKQSC